MAANLPSSQIRVNVCTELGWQSFDGRAGKEEIAACYRLPKTECRARYWGTILGVSIPLNYRALVWDVR